MINAASSKYVAIQAGTTTHTISGAITNGGTGFAQIDCLGYRYAVIDIDLSCANTTSNAPSLITLGEADATASVGGAGISDITAFHGLTATATNCGYLIAQSGQLTSGTAINTWRYNVDLKPRKRYLFVTVNPVTTQECRVNVILTRGELEAISATKMNVLQVVEG